MINEMMNDDIRELYIRERGHGVYNYGGRTWNKSEVRRLAEEILERVKMNEVEYWRVEHKAIAPKRAKIVVHEMFGKQTDDRRSFRILENAIEIVQSSKKY